MSHVEPATHEAKGHLYYYPEGADRFRGLDPYFFIGELLINHFDGHHELDTELDGEAVTITLAYSKSGIAPRPQDSVSNRLYEWELHVEGRGQRKCHYNLSPRFPDMRHYETGDAISVPFGHLDADQGVTVQFQASNFDTDEIASLLPRALDALADIAGQSMNPRYFDQPQGGRIDELERYVRLSREMNKKVIQNGGLMDRLAMLLSAEKGTKGKRTWDNTEEIGYHHQVILEQQSAGKLIDTHGLGKQLKSYLPKHPEKFEPDDPLYHPKFGALYRKSLNRNAIRWSRRNDLVDELDESLINCLHWADVPVDAGSAVFVADDHFAPSCSDEIPLFEDPCPRLEAEQDHLLLTVLKDLTDSDTDVVETVAADGGQHVDDLAAETGFSISTIYRALQRLDGILESKQGHVRFASQKIAEEIRAIVQSAEYAIESAADRAAHLFDVEVNQRSNSAISRWMAHYGAEFEPDAHDGRGKIRIDTIMSELKSRPQPYLPEALQFFYHAWISDGRRNFNPDDIIVDVQLASGKHVEAPLRILRE